MRVRMRQAITILKCFTFAREDYHRRFIGKYRPVVVGIAWTIQMKSKSTLCIGNYKITFFRSRSRPGPVPRDRNHFAAPYVYEGPVKNRYESSVKIDTCDNLNDCRHSSPASSHMCQRCPSRVKSCRCRTATRRLIEKSYRAAPETRWVINLPLPHRCRDGFQKNVPNFTATTVLDQKYWY